MDNVIRKISIGSDYKGRNLILTWLYPLSMIYSTNEKCV